MTKYTMELREIISTFGADEVKSWFSEYELSDYLTPEEVAVIEERGTWSKDMLANRIMEHFFTREICTDAIGQWRLFVKDKMHEVMETYAPLIYSSSIKFDPLVNVDYTEKYSAINEGESNSASKSTGSGLTVNSDTPQGQISKSEILQGKYASSTGANETENNIDDSTTNRGSQEYTKTMKGNSGVSATAQALIEQYRKYIRALNSEIVYELEPLFMGLY
ncbi:MAG: hypothetical protein J6S85_18305 [Methanobrevibacter sp.]|nr:hypothetical protein [Methanobrevibacter sp.]